MLNASAYYPQQKVDGLLKAASGMMWALVDELASAQAENEELQKQAARYKAAAAGKVTLEKVASPVSTLNKDKVAEFVSALVDHALIDEQHREKFAAACLSDANAALDVAMQAIRASESPVSQGSGYLNKAAGKFSTDSDRLKAEEEAVYRRWLH